MSQADMLALSAILGIITFAVALCWAITLHLTHGEEKKQRLEWVRLACERGEALGQKDKALQAKEEELIALRDRALSQETRLRELEGLAEELQAQVKSTRNVPLSGKIAVHAVLADDPRYQHMRAAYVALRAAGASIPSELAEYFGRVPYGPEGPPARPAGRQVRVPFACRRDDDEVRLTLSLNRRDIPVDAERLVVDIGSPPEPGQVVCLLPPQLREKL